jgi:hypothetical protein
MVAVGMRGVDRERNHGHAHVGGAIWRVAAPQRARAPAARAQLWRPRPARQAASCRLCRSAGAAAPARAGSKAQGGRGRARAERRASTRSTARCTIAEQSQSQPTQPTRQRPQPAAGGRDSCRGAARKETLQRMQLLSCYDNDST